MSERVIDKLELLQTEVLILVIVEIVLSEIRVKNIIEGINVLILVIVEIVLSGIYRLYRNK